MLYYLTVHTLHCLTVQVKRKVMTEARKKANAKWDKENMTIVGCRITKAKAQEFRDACAALGLVPNQILKQAVDETIKKAGE